MRDNIAYGRPNASDAEVEAAAGLAEAADFIDALPDGYATVVGERGQKLSGGQRQRLSLARALLTDPAILVLDEATSAVDNETEAAIQRSLARVAEGRTVIVIAHRLSTVREADRIWVLEAGRVAEAGTHDELVAAAGSLRGPVASADRGGPGPGPAGRPASRLSDTFPAAPLRRSAAEGARSALGLAARGLPDLGDGAIGALGEGVE